MEISSPKIKKSFIFSQKKKKKNAFLLFWEIELFRKWNFLASYFSYISGRNFLSSKS